MIVKGGFVHVAFALIKRITISVEDAVTVGEILLQKLSEAFSSL